MSNFKLAARSFAIIEHQEGPLYSEVEKETGKCRSMKSCDQNLSGAVLHLRQLGGKNEYSFLKPSVTLQRFLHIRSFSTFRAQTLVKTEHYVQNSIS